MLKGRIAICCLFMFVLSGCSAVDMFLGGDPVDTAGSQKAAPLKQSPFPQLDAWLAEHQLSVNAGQGEQRFDYDRAFAQGAVVVYGEGRPMLAVEGGQKRLTAIRAAEVVAQRTMAEYFSRYATNGEIRFRSYSTRMDALLKGAAVVASEYNSEQGTAAVLLKLDLKGAGAFAK